MTRAINGSYVETIPTISDDRQILGYSTAISAMEDGAIPESFPIHMWHAQTERYAEYWAWFDGSKLNEEQRVTNASGEPIYKFPLKINMVRTFARKRAGIVLGEADDTHLPLVRTVAMPKSPLTGDEPAESDKKLALILENIVNEVWIMSNGRSLQTENAVIGEFLGGSVIKLSYQPWREDLLIPIVIEQVIPDHFLPVWNPRNYLDLHEVYEVYRIPAKAAFHQYSIEVKGTSAIYVEHWTKDHYSILLDGKPITAKIGGETITYDKVENPFGRIPYAYLPTQRDGGNFYGSSFVPDVIGLMLEYNARMADNGDAIRGTVHRKRYIRNSNQTVSEKQIGEGTYAIDLGMEPPHAKNPPDVWTEDPPKFSPEMTGFTDDLWNQAMREGSMQSIAFGEDEGSQRSALTLAFRMWPTTSKARQTRTLWTDALNWVARMIVHMSLVKDAIPEGITIPADWEKRISFDQDWHPMIPRDREQEVSEVILAFQAGLMSPERALARLGGVKDIKDEINKIRQWLEFQSGLQSQGGAEDSGAGSGAKTDNPEPQVHAVDSE